MVLVQTVAGPLAGDQTALEVEVGPGAALELRTNAATLAYPADATAHHELYVIAHRRARFVWGPAPLILAAGCDLDSSVAVNLKEGAVAYTRETVVLGRHGEGAGRYRARLRCELEGRPLLHEGVEIDVDGVARSSGAVLAGARAFASLALLGVRPGVPPGPGELDLDGPGRVRRALAGDAVELSVKIEPSDTSFRRAIEAWS